MTRQMILVIRPSSSRQIRIRIKEVRIPNPIGHTQHSRITPVNFVLHIVLKVFCIQPLPDLDRRSISMFNFIQRAKHIKPSSHTWENVIRLDHFILKLNLPRKFAIFFKILKQDKRRPRVGKSALTSSTSSLQNNCINSILQQNLKNAILLSIPNSQCVSSAPRQFIHIMH